MFLNAALFLLLLPSSILAKSIPRATSSKPTGCLPYFDSFFFHRTLTFQDNEKPFRYAIVTRHTSWYPETIRNAMRFVAGIPSAYLGKEEKCGWHKARSANSNVGWWWTVHSGDVYWKYDDLRWVNRPKNSNIPSQWVAIDPTHYPSAADPTPDKSTLDSIVQILELNAPAGDVYETSTIVLMYLVSLFGFILLMLWVKRCAERGARSAMPKTWDDDNGIELDAIKAPDTDSPEGAAPKYSYEAAPPATQRSTSSTDTLRSEPLPIYSVDGAGS
jgi:hypothetical protein